MKRLSAVLLFFALPARADMFGVEDCYASYRRSLSSTSSGPCAQECPSGTADRAACFTACRGRLLPGGDPPLSRRQVCVTQHLGDSLTRLCGLSDDALATEIRHNTRNEAPSAISIAITTVCDDRQAAAQAAERAREEERALRAQLASLRESYPGDVSEALDRADLLSSKADVLRDKGDAGLAWAQRRVEQKEDAEQAALAPLAGCRSPNAEPRCGEGTPAYAAHMQAQEDLHAAQRQLQAFQSRRRETRDAEEAVSQRRSNVAWLQRCFDSKMDDSAGERTLDQIREDIAHLGNVRGHLLAEVDQAVHDLTPRVQTLAERLRADVSDGAQKVREAYQARRGQRQRMPFVPGRDEAGFGPCRAERWAVPPPVLLPSETQPAQGQQP